MTVVLMCRVQLTDDHVLHIINHLGTAYVIGTEVVSWLWPNEPDSLLTTKVCVACQVSVEKLHCISVLYNRFASSWKRRDLLLNEKC